MKLALASSYEILGPRQIARWNHLGDALEARGTQLFLLTTNIQPGLRVPHLQIPYGLSEFNALKLSPSEVTGQKQLLNIEQYWVRNFNKQQATTGLGICRHFYEDLLDRLEPDVVSIWNTQLPQGRIFQLLCEENDIPVFTIERGLLPETLLLDRGRLHSASELGHSLVHHSIARNYQANQEIVSAYKDFYAKEKPAKYSGGNDARRQKKALADSKKPLTLVLGQALGGGVLPRSNALARRNFPSFDSYEAVLKQLQDGLPEMQIGFRDHPINGWENAPVRLPQGTLRLEEGPLHEVLAQAEVVVVLGASTVLFEALVQEKPLVVVGNTQINAFSPYYACRDGDAVSAVKQAQEEGYAGMKDGAERALSFVLEHALVAEREEVPTAQKLDDLATFLSDYDLGAKTPLSERYEKLHFWGESL